MRMCTSLREKLQKLLLVILFIDLDRLVRT